MLLAVKAIDVQRGVWGLSSMWDEHAHVSPGGCVYKLVCPLAVAVKYGGSGANGRALRPTSSHLALLLLRGNEGSSSLEPNGRSNSVIKKHSTRPLVYVCDSLEREAGNWPATPSKPVPLQVPDL